jgi:HAD superfamily hydrolase (TIGR01509 family)
MSDAAVLLFDFGGTLDADGVHWAPRFYAAYRAAGGAAEYSHFEQVFRRSDAAVAGLPGVRALGFRALVEAQARVLLELLPQDAWDAAAAARRFHAAALAVVTRNRPIVERLARRYRLGVVSNFTGNLEPCLVELGLRPWFSAVVDSGVLGVAKPDPRAFGAALETLGVAPERAWMVGDNLETDVRPAAALGMRTCWVTPADREAPVGAPPTARVAHLGALEAVLERHARAAVGPCTD